MEQGNPSYNKQTQATSTPSLLPPLGPGFFSGNADWLNNLNNSQGLTLNPFELNPSNHGTMGDNDKAPTLGTDAPAEPKASQPQPAQSREHELYMPIANVVRIMRRALPPHAKVADEAKEMVQECVSEFISFVTGEANEACQMERRKTITAEDIIAAMGRLGFEQYVEPLKMYLQKYRESELLPPVSRRGGSHGGNTGLGHDSGAGGARVVPTTDSLTLPHFAVPLVPPQFGMFGSLTGSVGGGYYHDGSGPMNVGQTLTAVATVHDGDGPSPSLTLGCGDGASESEVVGPTRSSQTGLGFQPYVPKK